MNKKVSLKEIVGTKIVYAIILTSYYWMWARTDWKDWYEMMQYVLGVFLFSFFSVQMIRISKYKKEGIDEMAKLETMRFNLLKTFCWCNGCSCFWCCHFWSYECRQYWIYWMDDCVVDFGFIYYSYSDVCSYG